MDTSRPRRNRRKKISGRWQRPVYFTLLFSRTRKNGRQSNSAAFVELVRTTRKGDFKNALSLGLLNSKCGLQLLLCQHLRSHVALHGFPKETISAEIKGRAVRAALLIESPGGHSGHYAFPFARMFQRSTPYLRPWYQGGTRKRAQPLTRARCRSDSLGRDDELGPTRVKIADSWSAKNYGSGIGRTCANPLERLKGFRMNCRRSALMAFNEGKEPEQRIDYSCSRLF